MISQEEDLVQPAILLEPQMHHQGPLPLHSPPGLGLTLGFTFLYLAILDLLGS